MVKVSVIVFAEISDDLPPEEKFDREFRQRKIEETIRALSSIIPDLTRRVLARIPAGACFSVQLSPDEYSDLDEYLSRNKNIGDVMIDGPVIRPAR